MIAKRIKSLRQKLIDRCASTGLDRMALININGDCHWVPVDEALDSTLIMGADLIGVYTPNCPQEWLERDWADL